MSIGSILLIVAIGKFSEPLFLKKIYLSPINLVGAVFDLAAGVALVTANRSKVVLGLLIFGFLGILVYRITHWSQSCDCLGRFTQYVSDWVMISFVVLALALAAIPLIFKRASGLLAPFRWESVSVGIAFAIGVMVCSVAQFLLLSASGDFVATLKAERITNFKFDGEIRLKNTWAQLITILGSSGLPCNGVVSIPENLVIESGHAVNLKVSSLPGVTRGGVSTGSFTMFVAQRDTLRSSTVRWAASKID